MIIDARKNPPHIRWKVVDARTGLEVRRPVVYADDSRDVIGVLNERASFERIDIAASQGRRAKLLVEDFHVPRVVIDHQRLTILIYVAADQRVIGRKMATAA